jgi:hypothetical protein
MCNRFVISGKHKTADGYDYFFGGHWETKENSCLLTIPRCYVLTTDKSKVDFGINHIDEAIPIGSSYDDVKKWKDQWGQPLPGSDEELITVCDNCYRASCWHGIFMCDDSDIAGTIELSRRELLRINKEHPDYITNYPKPLF